MDACGEIWFSIYTEADFEYLIVLNDVQILLLCFTVVIVKLVCFR